MRAESPRPAFTAAVPGRSNRAFTLIEVLVVLAVLALLVAMLVPALTRNVSRARRISCVGNLKNIGLAYRIFSTDHTNFPWQVSLTNGGSMEYAGAVVDAWRHFATISNEISTPKIVVCPADPERRGIKANIFRAFTNNLYLSYFLGLTANEANPQSILSGDRNLTLDGISISNAIFTFGINANVAWDTRIHRQAGNILLGDGSVQQVSSGRLREHFRDAAASGGPQKLVIP